MTHHEEHEGRTAPFDRIDLIEINRSRRKSLNDLPGWQIDQDDVIILLLDHNRYISPVDVHKLRLLVFRGFSGQSGMIDAAEGLLTLMLQKPEGLQSQGAKGATVVHLLQALGNAGSGVLRLSRRVDKIA